MSIANFEQLCLGICELAGFQPPRLLPDARGTTAFSVRLRGVPVTVLELGPGREGMAYLVADMGTLTADEAPAGWRALMDANSALPCADAPRFSRNPRTGEAVMQWACAMQDVTVVDVYQRISRMVDAALGWRRDRVVHPWTPGSRQSLPGATARFHALYQELCGVLGQVPQPAPADGGATAVQLCIGGVNLVMAHLPLLRPDVALVGVPFGAPAPAAQGGDVVAMMDANFVLATQPHGAAFCRDAASGDLLLRYAYPLAGSGGRHCLAQLVSVAAFVREWNTLQARAGAAPGAAPAPSPSMAEFA